MKKITSLLIVTGILLIVGCGKKESGDVVTIRFANAEGLPDQIKMMKDIVNKFEKTHPKIKVELSYGITIDKIMTEIAANTPADVFMWWNPIVDLKERGALLPLDDFVKKNNIDMTKYWKQLVDAFTYDGKLYAWPLQLKTVALVYNKDLFDREGVEYPNAKWTWNDYYNAAKKIKRDTDGDGITDQFGSLVPYPTYMVLMNGGKMIDEKKKICVIDKDPKTIQALKFLRKLIIAGCPTPAEQEAMKGMVGTQGFMMGKVGMVMAPTWMLTSFSTINTFKWSTAPVPKPLSGKLYELYEGAALCLAKQSKHPEEAFKFLSFYGGDVGMEIFAKARNGIPGMREPAYKFFAAPPYEYLQAYLDAAERMKVFTTYKYIRNTNEIMQPFSRYWDLVNLNKIDLDTAMKKATKEINENLRKQYNGT